MAIDLLMWIPMFILVCIPIMTHKDTDTFDRALCWASLIATPVLYILFILPIQAWSPLTDIHIAATNSAVGTMCDCMLSILANPKLLPREAMDRLSALERVDACELRQELKIWGQQSTGLCFLVLHGITLALFTFFAPVDISKIRVESTLAQGVRIWFAVFSVLYFVPWAFAFLSEAARPAKRWKRFVQSVMRDAGVLHHARTKFGDTVALKEWLNQNNLCLRLAGIPIDETLAAKMLAATGSLVSIFILIFARLMGYY